MELVGQPPEFMQRNRVSLLFAQGAIFQSSVRFLDSLIEAVDSGNTSITSGIDVERGFNLPRAINPNNKMIEQQV